MADAAIGVVTEALLKTVGSLIAVEVWLIWGVKEELEKLSGKLKMIQALLADAQSKQITNGVVQLWLKKLQSIALDAQILLEEFSYQVLCRKVECRMRDKVRRSFSSSNAVSVRSKMAHKLKDVLSSLEELLKEANGFGFQPVELINSLPDLKEMRLTVPYFDDSMVVGREDAVANVISMLTKSYLKSELPVITVHGMGGQGKTTLAQMVYKSDMVKSYFDVRVWVCVSDDFNVKRLLAEMQSPTQVDYQSASCDDLVSKLKVGLKGKKYLLVLDDVWNDKGGEWERMRSCLLEVEGASGSKILATTRSVVVAKTMRSSECLPLGVLSKEQSWKLFEKCAFAEGGPTKTPQLVDIGEKILKRCGGVPLAIKTIGGSLYSMNSEADWSLIEKSDMWSTYSGGDQVLAAIKLSYDQLPSLSVKQCFAYCAIFEKDRVMEKDELIQLWMAHGFLNVPEGSPLQMEDVGDMYYNILLRNSLFQAATEYGKQYCKMHDLVHDVSLYVSEHHCLHIKDCTDLEIFCDAVHVSVTASEGGQRKSLKGFLPSNLRTLYLKNTSDLTEDLFQDLESVVALTIENRDAKELPNSVGKMKLLRFLDIRRTGIRKLPRWLTKLYHLQTLRVEYLAKVPKGFGNLINLRHIHFSNYCYYYDDGTDCLFKGLGQLRNLQTLPYFRVGRSEDGCPIGELECLNNLRGRLRIFGLENVGSYDSAAKSKLSNKSNIRALALHCDDDDDVAEGLKPCSTLTDLAILGFRGSNCPSWVKKDNLGNLVKLELVRLNKCHKLPSLGDFHCLEDLVIRDLPNVRSIGQEFYGLSNVVSRGSKIIVFPALKSLHIGDMESLMEWSDAKGIISSSSVQVTVFPNLKDLEIKELPKLRVFPNLGTLPSLTDLEVRGCKNMKISQVELLLQSLSSLSLINCEHLCAPLCRVIKHPAQLERLWIQCNPESWPKDLHHLSSMKQLSISSWPQNVYEKDCLPWPLTHSTSLTSLRLLGYGLPRVTFLPCQIQHLTTLTHIYILDFDGLECIPDWLGNLEQLQTMTLTDCKNLNQLPSVEAFQRLANLRDLQIRSCPLLQERCKEGIGSEWPKIAHIPNLDIE